MQIDKTKLSREELCQDEQVKVEYIKILNSHGMQQKYDLSWLSSLPFPNLHILFRLQKFEIPRAVCLVSEAWTPESGLLTAAMKLKRKTIESVFSAEIAAMYLPAKKISINNNV